MNGNRRSRPRKQKSGVGKVPPPLFCGRTSRFASGQSLAWHRGHHMQYLGSLAILLDPGEKKEQPDCPARLT
jgi:hypothetical protein